MNCQVVTTTLKLRSYVSSLLPDHPGSDRTLSAPAESGFIRAVPAPVQLIAVAR